MKLINRFISKGGKVVIYGIGFIGALFILLVIAAIFSKPAEVKKLEAQVGPLPLSRKSPAKMEFTEDSVALTWYADARFMGEPQVTFEFEASKSPTPPPPAGADRIKGTYEEFYSYRKFMGLVLKPVRAQYMQFYMSSSGNPSEGELKDQVLKNVKIVANSPEEFFNSPEIHSILQKSTEEKDGFLKLMKSKYGFSNLQVYEKASKPIGDWAVVELERTDPDRYVLNYYFKIAPEKEFSAVSKFLFDQGLVTMTGGTEAKEWKDKFPYRTAEIFIFRGKGSKYPDAKMLKDDFEEQLRKAAQ